MNYFRMSSKKIFQCAVCDYIADSKKGLSVHISRNASKERKTTGSFNLFEVINRIYNDEVSN